MARSALVTGGNRGIGLAIARQLAAGGDRVTVTSRSGEQVEGLATVACDVREAASVEEAFTKVEAEQGPVEVLVANAGITHDQLLALMSEDAFTSVVDTNLTGAYRVAKRAVRPMMRLRHGRLIFISSVVGLLGSSGQANYASSKAGLVGLARSLARELARHRSDGSEQELGAQPRHSVAVQRQRSHRVRHDKLGHRHRNRYGYRHRHRNRVEQQQFDPLQPGSPEFEQFRGDGGNGHG